MKQNLRPSPAQYAREYRTAAGELEHEQHEFRGRVDVLKALLLWIETTEERVSKNLGTVAGVAPARTKS